ncbi:hypothetical protein NC653_003773 [Populus alba x Populus x berolinensis]|uniref:Secreted protein n=1 Tax=Populus alba x Populus x berolinensis TaxID=444605 RepID=A0AAD6RSD6_9ROSI|nr:hypothetical protein NC653_003773 [Populus alba x Populus x berolinensis]
MSTLYLIVLSAALLPHSIYNTSVVIPSEFACKYVLRFNEQAMAGETWLSFKVILGTRISAPINCMVFACELTRCVI